MTQAAPTDLAPRMRLAIMPRSGCSLLACEDGSGTVGSLPVRTAMESARRPVWAVRWSRWSRSPRTSSSEYLCYISRRSAAMLVASACTRPAALAHAQVQGLPSVDVHRPWTMLLSPGL